MNVKTFIDRPIFAGVISVMILLLGVIGLVQLPVEQFPEIAPPTVSVSAAYAGANAETVQRSVLVPLEEAINGVEDMMYMVSSATNSGSASIQIYFRQGTDGHGDGQCTEPNRFSTEPSSRRSYPKRCDRAQAPDQPHQITRSI